MSKTFSNRYIFIYSAVLVVVAALILTVVSVSLKPLQTKNQQAETKQMILKTIGVEATRDNAAELYAKHITEADGYYRFDGGIVLPLKGTGLWGPIWGYLALDSTSTVVGAVFDHKGETPGLGGEIAEPWFYNQFDGVSLKDAAGAFSSAKIVKGGANGNPNGVDAISGATITSRSLENTIAAWMDYYKLILGE